MIECIFTLDYEIYGNGEGTLRDLGLEPTARLAGLFQDWGVPFVVFPEALEFARIEEAGSDPDTAVVRTQLRELRAVGHEIGLHVHPWWANARHENGHWWLDWSERNICLLKPDRVEAIVSGAIGYLRDALGDPRFTPLTFRSGLWVMQPTAVVAKVLVRHGVRVDSSVFKGGRDTTWDWTTGRRLATVGYGVLAPTSTCRTPVAIFGKFPFIPRWCRFGRCWATSA